jgi:hypothetical protein
MKTRPLLPTIALISLLQILPAYGRDSLTETWETGDIGDFNGHATFEWSGDTNDFQIANATWPTGEDQTGAKSLRSGNGAGGQPSTILTDVSDIYSSSNTTVWSMFLSGNAATITTGKRVDMILLANSSDPTSIESPNGLSAWKLSLWDPLNGGGQGHGPAPLSYSLSLWKASPTDTSWQLMSAHEFASSLDIRSGWQIDVTRNQNGRWRVSFTNGVAGSATGQPVIDLTDTYPSSGSGAWFSGIGLLSTATDLNDFGFDNFTVSRMPKQPAFSHFEIATNALHMSFSDLTPASTVTVECCYDLLSPTGWHAASTFIPTSVTTNLLLPLPTNRRSAYYRAIVK